MSTPDPIPFGYCQCGCGGKTNLAARTRPAQGLIKGQPVRFLVGHNVRVYQDVGGDLRICRCCKQMLLLESFYRYKNGPSGRASRCKACQRKLRRNQSEETRAKVLKEQRKRRTANAEHDNARQREYRKRPGYATKSSARSALNQAVRNGTLERPTVCENCQREDIEIQAHHWDYSKPLDVHWLCTRCHGLRHRDED